METTAHANTPFIVFQISVFCHTPPQKVQDNIFQITDDYRTLNFTHDMCVGTQKAECVSVYDDFGGILARTFAWISLVIPKAG